MLKQVAMAIIVMVAIAVPARADLHYTMHTEARQITTADPVNPMFGMASDILMRTMFPDGATDTTYWISDKGVRVELTKATAFAPAGAVFLQLVDGTMLVLNPNEHTYWKLNLPAMTPTILMAMTRLNPQAAVVHTGEFDTIAGVRAEHITSTMTMELPLPPTGMPLPPGMPTSIATTTDSWNSDQYASYAALAKSTANMMGLGGLIPEGFMLKNVMRNSMMPGFEIESVVTSNSEEPAPADAFDIPADYKEIVAPMPLGIQPPPPR